MMSQYLVYLAGPMTGLTVAEASEWRNYVRVHLPPCIKTRSPVLSEYRIDSKSRIPKESSRCSIMGSGRVFARKDKNDVKRSDLVLFNFLGAKSISIGTLIEVGWADMADVPTVLVIEKRNLHQHPILTEVSDVIVNNLADAINAVKALLLDDDKFLEYGQPLPVGHKKKIGKKQEKA